MVERTRRWRWGVHRWIVLLFVILGVLAARAYAPILPHVALPAERITTQPLFTLPVIGEFYLTNTMVATLIADLLLILAALAVRRAIRRGDQVLSGIAGVVEALVEALYSLGESTAGKWAKKIFPWMATIVLLVLVVNWMELIPGVDSIGVLHEVHGEAEGYPAEELFRIGSLPVMAIVKPDAAGVDAHADDHGQSYGVVPFVRVASTDLNFTIALALTSVFMTQVFGIRALGASYFSKFFYVKTIFTKPIFGVIDFAVGLLELVSEISKVLSFSFRLFGNIFAGSVLLFVIGSLIPVFAQSIFLLLEFFIGLIQAIVFGMLTMVFMSQAVAGHGDEAGH